MKSKVFRYTLNTSNTVKDDNNTISIKYGNFDKALIGIYNIIYDRHPDITVNTENSKFNVYKRTILVTEKDNGNMIFTVSYHIELPN